MRKFKFMPKLAAGMLATAMVFGSLSGLALNTPVSVYAEGAGDGGTTDPSEGDGSEDESTTGPKVEIDYETYTATITGGANAKYAFLELWKLGDKNATGFNKTNESKDKLSTTYSYELKGDTNTVTVDLSFLKATTIQAIKVYTDENTEEKYEKVLPAQPGKLSGLKYNSATNTFDVSKAKVGGTAIKAEELIADYEYRGQYSAKWDDLANFTDVNHISAGSTIIIRKKANLTDAPAPAGPEAKVKITAAAKAPKVAIDYKKGTIKITDKMEYASVGTTTESGDIKFTQGSKTALSLTALRESLGGTSESDLVIFVRTSGDESKGKPDSNVTPVTIPADVKLEDNGKFETDGEGTISVVGETTLTSSVTYKKGTSGSGNNVKETFVFTVHDADYEFTTDAPDKENRTWKAVKDEKTYVVTLSNSTSPVYIRRAGVKGKTAEDSYFPSGEILVTVPAKSSEKEAAAAPTVADGVVSIGSDTVATFARDASTASTINITVSAGKGGLLEYSLDGTEWKELQATTALENQANAVTIKVRVKETDDKAASTSVDVVIAAAN